MADNNPSIDELFNLRASFPSEEERRDFFYAARSNDISRLKKIIEKWPDAPEKWRDSEGKPVLMAAYNAIKDDTIDFLIKKGASTEHTRNDGSYNALIYAAFLSTMKDVEKFLRAGADPNGRDNNKNTALHLVVQHNAQPEIIDLLVVCGADPRAKNKWGSTPLDECKNPEHRDIIKAAQARRDAFLKNYSSKASAPALLETATEDSDEIKLLKRIELRKGNENTPSAPANAKKPWWKLGF